MPKLKACLLTGFMRERDFVEEMRPTLLEIVERNMRRQQGVPPVGRAVESAVRLQIAPSTS